MKRFFYCFGVFAFLLLVVGGGFGFWKLSPFIFARSASAPLIAVSGEPIRLPAPAVEGTVSLEETLAKRRSVRSFENTPVPLAALGQILWAAQGITLPEKGYRTAPSAMSSYPLRVYAVVESVADLPPGLYAYQPEEHALLPVFSGPAKERAMTAVRQPWILSAPVVLIITGRYEQLEKAFGDAARFCVDAETGHASQNVYLQATALGLGTVSAGGVDGEALKEAFSIPVEETPLYAMPLGFPKTE